MENRIRAIAEALDAEPLFHMSLASKELFHSNFIWWLAREHPDASEAVFGEWTSPDPEQLIRRAEREASALDVVLHMPGRSPLVIENKVFSLPDLEQLDEYAEDKTPKLVPKAKKNQKARPSPSLVLLSLADPEWPNDEWEGTFGTWRCKGYKGLRDALSQQVELVRRADSYAGDTLAHYCNFLGLLIELADVVRVRSDDEDVELGGALLKPLDDRRLGDAVKKLRMYQVAHRLKERLRAESCAVTVDQNLLRNQPLVEGFIKFDGTNDVGWQYQSGEFRLAMRVHAHEGRSEASDRQRRAFASRYPEWFDFTHAASVLGPHRHPKRARLAPGEFHAFAPTFLCLPHIPNRISVAQLLDVACHYSRVAAAMARS